MGRPILIGCANKATTTTNYRRKEVLCDQQIGVHSGETTQSFKAETHDATNCCDTSLRQVAATNRLV